jgi:hypothetical protein
MLWNGISDWHIHNEWERSAYLLINIALILLSKFFHPYIFKFFGVLGILVYLEDLGIALIFSSRFLFAVGVVGFLMILAATFFIRSKKIPQMSHTVSERL